MAVSTQKNVFTVVQMHLLQSNCLLTARAGIQCPLFPFPLMANFSPVFTLHELLGGPCVCFDGALPESLVLLIPSY